MSGVVSKISTISDLLLKTNSYRLKFDKFRLLNVLYVKVCNEKYFEHICPKLVTCLVRIVDKDFIPCSTYKD